MFMSSIVKPCYPLEEPAPTNAIKKASLQQASARENLNHSSTFVRRWAALSFLLGPFQGSSGLSQIVFCAFRGLSVCGRFSACPDKVPPSKGIPPIKGIRVSCQMRYDV